MDNSIIFLSDVRLSFPHLTAPHSAGGDPNAIAKYSADFIMPAEHPGFVQFMQRVSTVATEKWAAQAGAILQMINTDRKSRCFGRGEEKLDKKTLQPYDGYAGMVFISANREFMPQMILADGSPVDSANTMACQQVARGMYGGCRVNAAVKPWAQDNKHGRGIRCDLVAIQFLKDDAPFGEGVADASGMFGQVAAPAAGVATPAGAADPGVPGFGDPAIPNFL